MKKIFLFLVAMVYCVGSVEATGHKFMKCNGYDIVLDNDSKHKTITVFKGGQSVFEFSEGSEPIDGIEVANYCKANILGNGMPVVVVMTGSDGPYSWDACYILELGAKFRVMQKIEVYEGEIEFVPQDVDKSYKIIVEDATCVHFVPWPFPYEKVTLKFDGDKFVFDKEAMKRKISKEEFDKLIADLSIKLTNDISSYERKRIVADEVMHLIYSGNGNFAMQLIDIVWRKYYDFAEFKSGLLETLIYSPYIDGIKEINDGMLILPDK